MATYDMPEWLRVAAMEWGIQKSGLLFASPHNGTTQSHQFLGERFVASIRHTPALRRNSGRLEALFSQLAGGVHRLRMHHLGRPVPVGTMRGTPTLAATANARASQLVIGGAGLLSGANLLRFTDQLDNAYWVKTNLNVTPNAIAAPDGSTTMDLLVENTTASVQHVLAHGFGGYVAGLDYTGSVFVRNASGNRAVRVQPGATTRFSATATLVMRPDTGAVVSAGAGLKSWRITDAGNGSWRVEVTATCSSSGAGATLLVLTDGITSTNTTYTGDGTSGVYAWGAQVEQASAASPYSGRPSLVAGDLFSVGGQLFQVAADAVMADAGTITVDVLNRARASIASGAAVTWDRPTTEFIVPALSARFAHVPVVLEGGEFDFLEVW